MATPGPRPISDAQRAARLRHVTRIARRLGFVGRVEYRHVFSNTGGAQFGLGSTIDQDLLVVYADAFVRDANPDDFSLEAIIAHERGHQLVYRTRRLPKLLGGRIGPVTEEVLASLGGSLLVQGRDSETLALKAVTEAVRCGISLVDATELVKQLRKLLERVL